MWSRGGVITNHGTGSRCTLPRQCRPPSPRRRWRCDRSSYKRSLFSRIRDSLMHYLTGPETTGTLLVTVSGLCGIEPLRNGQAHRSLGCAFPSPAGDHVGGLAQRATRRRPHSKPLVGQACSDARCRRAHGARFGRWRSQKHRQWPSAGVTVSGGGRDLTLRADLTSLGTTQPTKQPKSTIRLAFVPRLCRVPCPRVHFIKARFSSSWAL